jgi:alpha-tubulin suppressor-like RCC1 family protein
MCLPKNYSAPSWPLFIPRWTLYQAVHSPVKIDVLENFGIKSVHCGHQWSAFLTFDGKMYVCGQDRYHGAGGTGSTPIPKRVMAISDPIVQISLGAEYTLVLDCHGDVWGWGTNSDGQVGSGNFSQIVDPQIILKGKERFTILHLILHDIKTLWNLSNSD